MKPSTASQPADSESARTDAIEAGGEKRYGNRHFRPIVTNGPLKSQMLPEGLKKFFRRSKDTHR